jgi:hypothetical protein
MQLEPRNNSRLTPKCLSSIDDVDLDPDVVRKKVSGVGGVRHDPSHFGGGQDDVFGTGFGVEAEDRVSIAEVKFGGEPT